MLIGHYNIVMAHLFAYAKRQIIYVVVDCKALACQVTRKMKLATTLAKRNCNSALHFALNYQFL